MCLNPKWIYKKGYYKNDNYHGLQGDFYEIGTYSKCGSCSICIAEKANNWVIRNHYESTAHEKKCFITLTYRENPIILVRKDIQDFMKRLRITLKRQDFNEKIRMFQAGEYGEKLGRPHFHIIIYGWEDKNAKYLGINKRKNILYKSELIEKVWGLGRTSYQKFNDKEIPYIALYNTPQETFKKAYKMSREKLKKIEDYAIKNPYLEDKQRKNLIEELKKIRAKFEDEKIKYIMLKEFNSWSLALGWNKFYTEYAKKPRYVFTEYIESAEIVTPSPWVKKLANMGDFQAIKEMQKREKMIQQSANEAEERLRNEMKVYTRRKKELLDHLEDTKNGDIREM